MTDGVRFQRIDAGSYSVHGSPHISVLRHFNGWAVWDDSRYGMFPWARMLFRGRTLNACREWLNTNALPGGDNVG